jgi:hypothetical protein
MTTTEMKAAGAAVVPAHLPTQPSATDGDSFAGRAVRQTTSCVECQRRKQKVSCFLSKVSFCPPPLTPRPQCSREWPCDKCQGRKIPHLCRFVANKSAKGDAGFAKYAFPVCLKL